MTFKHVLKEIPSYNTEEGVTKKMFDGEGIQLILWRNTKDRKLVSFEIRLIRSVDTAIRIHWNAKSAFGDGETFSTTTECGEEGFGFDNREMNASRINLHKDKIIPWFKSLAGNLKKETLDFIVSKLDQHM